MPDITNAEQARASFESAREEFRQLILGLSSEEWNRKSDNRGWTNSQLCWHLAFGAGIGTRSTVNRLRKNQNMSPPAPLMAVLNLVSLWMVRIRARGATPESVCAFFDEGYAKTLDMIDTVGDDEWGTSAEFLGQPMTVGGAFGLLAQHIAEHGAEMRRS